MCKRGERRTLTERTARYDEVADKVRVSMGVGSMKVVGLMGEPFCTPLGCSVLFLFLFTSSSVMELAKEEAVEKTEKP